MTPSPILSPRDEGHPSRTSEGQERDVVKGLFVDSDAVQRKYLHLLPLTVSQLEAFAQMLNVKELEDLMHSSHGCREFEEKLDKKLENEFGSSSATKP